jgi:hypothetical protein
MTHALPSIVGFHQDEEGHWVADLECGHTRHVRHEPPWMERPWVLTEEGRAGMLGTRLACAECREQKRTPPSDGGVK